MASAVDSGVDTGNDSNDSTVQDKLSKMDLEGNSQILNRLQTADCEKEIASGPEQDQDLLNRPHSSSSEVTMVNTSWSHLHPSSLMHGYECRPKPTLSETCFALSLQPAKDIGGVFVSGGPLGTRCRRSDLDKMRVRMRHSVPRYSCRPGSIASYIWIKETVRMCRAACQNNTEAMRRMLESGNSPNVRDGYKRTPLHLAACMGYTDMVKLLLDHGADPNAKDSIGNTPLHLAACTNHVAVITLLLKAGTRITASHSPLQLAITKFNIIQRSIMPHPVLKEQVAQVISMLTEYMRRKEGPSLDADLLNKFESLVRVSDSSEQVENNIRDLLSNLSSLSISSSS